MHTQVCRSFIVLITNAPGLHAYSVRSVYRNLKSQHVSFAWNRIALHIALCVACRVQLHMCVAACVLYLLFPQSLLKL